MQNCDDNNDDDDDNNNKRSIATSRNSLRTAHRFLWNDDTVLQSVSQPVSLSVTHCWCDARAAAAAAADVRTQSVSVDCPLFLSVICASRRRRDAGWPPAPAWCWPFTLRCLAASASRRETAVW